MRPFLTSALLLLVAIPAAAATFTLRHEDRVLTGGEICLFESGAPDDPLKRLTTFSSVTCSPADESVTLPEGTWNLFARHSSGLVSELLLVRDQRVEGDRREIALVPARSIAVDPPGEGERVALYAEHRGTVIPLVPGESSVLAPTKERVFPLFLADGRVAAIGEGMVVDDEMPAKITRPKPVDGKRDLAAGVVPDPVAFEALALEERLPGSVELSGTGLDETVKPANDVAPVFAARPLLALFRSVAVPEDLSASVVGDGWVDSSVAMTSQGAADVLRVAPATALAVRWSLAADVPDLVREFAALAPCESQENQPKRPYPPGTPTEGLSVSLWRCPGFSPDSNLQYVYIPRCELISAKMLPSGELSGEATLEGVTTGLYLLRLAHEPLPATFRIVEIHRPSQVVDIDLAFDRWFGKITYGGDPIRAAVGLGWGGVSDAKTGEYTSVRAVVPPPAKPPPLRPKGFTAPIFVEACSEEIAYGYIPEETPPSNSRVDIDIPLNVVRVVAKSAETGEPVEGASITYGAALPDLEGAESDGAHFAGEWGRTDAEGWFTVNNVPPNRKLLFCASHDRFERQCADRFAMGADRERELNLFLTPVETRAGRVNRQPIERGQVLWYAADGRMTEMTSVESDGTFSYKKDHPAGELLFVIAANAPLLATVQPNLAQSATLVIDYPAAQVRSFEVTLDPATGASGGLITVALGETVVPGNVLLWHLNRHGVGGGSVMPSSTTPVPDILATGPISFLFASQLWLETNAPRDGRDFFYGPAAIALPRTPAGDSTRVVLGGVASNLRIATTEEARTGR